MERGSISERVTAMTEPIKTVGKCAACVIIRLTFLQLTAGFMGFIPAYGSLNEYSTKILVYIPG